MAGTRSDVAGSFTLMLDGMTCGFLKAVDGGGIFADVAQERPVPGQFTKKHLAGVKYEDIQLTVGFSMAQALYDWMAATLARSYLRKDGAIVASDFKQQAKTERQFFHALITEIGFPALDGASKEAGYLTVKLSPELIRNAAASGSAPGQKPVPQKQFVTSNFRLELDGIDCTKVSRIEAFTVKQPIATDVIGQARDIANQPGPVEIPNLRVTIAAAGAATWEKWFADFVIAGNDGDDREKSGAIVFLGPDRKQEFGRVGLSHVGIFALHHPSPQAGEAIQHVVADLYCEGMKLQIGKPAPQPPPVAPPPPAPPVEPVEPVRPVPSPIDRPTPVSPVVRPPLR